MSLYFHDSLPIADASGYEYLTAQQQVKGVNSAMDRKESALPPALPVPAVPPSSLNRLTEEKLTTFVIGNQKKSRFQKVGEKMKI